MAEVLCRQLDRTTARGAKADRALELWEGGLDRTSIAERLGVNPRNIGGMLQRAKERRERGQA